MTCFYCKGNIESSTTTYMTDYQGCYIIIKNVPCEKCSQCGEEYLNGETLERIEEIIQKVKPESVKLKASQFFKSLYF